MDLRKIYYLWNYKFSLLLFFCSLSIRITKNQEIPGIDISKIQQKNAVVQFHQDIIESEPSDSSKDHDIHIMKPGMEKMLFKSGATRLQIFCYSGESKNLLTILKTIELVVKVPQDNFKYYEGSNYSSVRNQYDGSSWFTYTPWRPSSFRLGIFNPSCIGIETNETFQASLKVRYVDLWRVVSLAIGITLFLMAPLLAHNEAFHYMTGISIGIFGSLLVIVYILSRFVPKKAGAVTFLLGGWGLVAYIFQYIWNNCTSLLKEYHSVAAGYVIAAGVLSFAVVYRWGPVKDARSLKLVQWSLQLVGLAAVFISSQYQEFTLAVVLILLANYNFPSSWKAKITSYWLRHFPPKQRLLTEEEYLEQSRVETKKAIEELKEFCQSPKCNAWKTISILKTPQRYVDRTFSSCKNKIEGNRFAEFVEGGSHLTDDEILSYEGADFRAVSNTDDDDDDLMTTDEDDS